MLYGCTLMSQSAKSIGQLNFVSRDISAEYKYHGFLEPIHHVCVGGEGCHKSTCLPPCWLNLNSGPRDPYGSYDWLSPP